MALEISIVVIVTLGLGLVAWLTRNARTPEATPPPRKPDPDPDSEVLFQLAVAGLDLSKPQEPGFFLYFPRREAADQAAREIEAAGFSATVELGSGGEQWLCLAKKSMVLTRDALVAIRVAFSELAARHDGEYDGWGAPVSSASA